MDSTSILLPFITFAYHSFLFPSVGILRVHLNSVGSVIDRPYDRKNYGNCGFDINIGHLQFFYMSPFSTLIRWCAKVVLPHTVEPPTPKTKYSTLKCFHLYSGNFNFRIGNHENYGFDINIGSFTPFNAQLLRSR